MTPNTSPKKPDWFALIENSAPSARVRKVDKKLPAATAIVALAIVAFGTFFANGSINFDSSPTSNTASTSMSTVTSTEVPQTTDATAAVTQTPVQNAQAVKSVKVVAPQSINGIADPTLNSGGDDDRDNDNDNDDDDDEDDDDRD
jgi:hypothetical protein